MLEKLLKEEIRNLFENLIANGDGLDLFIVKSVVELGGGKVRFESEENKGTTFYFTIPIKNI